MKKTLLIGGLKPSEFLWRLVKKETGLGEEEMGRFLLGSTVILLFPQGTVAWDERYGAGSETRMGEALASSR